MKRSRFSQILILLSLFLGFSFGANAFSTVDLVFSTDLPREAQQTLALIKQNGPFPYDRDGVIFGNFEKRLPREQRGFYREYTVKTPGERSRGARRIIAGGNPPTLFYYTDDHYQSFRRIRE